MTLFELKSVSVRFGALAALKNIDLQVLQGQRLALIGSNGSGKSTLLRVLNGLVSSKTGQQSGHLTGVIKTDTNLRQAMLFQRPHMLRMSVQANVAMGLWLGGMPWTEAKALAFQGLARVGLQAEAARSAKTLSQGQQQRVALARAWAMLSNADQPKAQSKVLLLDEPTASMDPHAKHEVEALMQDFATHNTTLVTTLVFASHNLGQVKRLATHVAYLEHGRLLAYLPVDDFFKSEKLRAVSLEADAFLKGETT